MNLDNVEIDMLAGKETEFEAAVRQAKPLFLHSKGCTGVEPRRSIENPQRYRLLVSWQMLEDHTVDFRSSVAFTEWRRLVSDFFAAPPRIEHHSPVARD
jgi:quinol monooxygenase YgiN